VQSCLFAINFLHKHPNLILLRNRSMEKDSGYNISKFCDIDPPEHLRGVILARIAKEARKRQLRRKMLLFGGFFVSGAGVISSLTYFGREILASDFWSIASLVFSDLGTVAGHWQDYSFSLLETLPVVSIIAILVPIAAMLILTKQYAEKLVSYENNTLTTSNV
jgi:hypothetical protein